MNKRRIVGGAVFVSVLVAMGVACRQGVPSDDPKTPANSPIPEIDRKDQDPKTAPTPDVVGDGG